MPNHGERFRVVLENRYGILQYLATTSATKPEMVEALETSRSTVDRAVSDLTEIDCITLDNGRYTATTVGHLALQEHARYRTTTEAIRGTGELINYLSDDAPLDTRMLDGAAVTMAEEHAPEQALAPSIDLFEQANRLRGLAPVVLGFYPRLIANRLANSDLTVEIVAEPDVLTTLPDVPTLGENSLSEMGGVTLYETDVELPYALWLMDTPKKTYAGLTAYDSNGVVGALINDADAAVQWATDQYQEYRAGASQVAQSEK